MKVYFDKEGLIESLEFYRDNNARYFLFFSVSSVYPFVKYEEELAEINDYCLFVLCQLENKLKALIAEMCIRDRLHVVVPIYPAEQFNGPSSRAIFCCPKSETIIL